MSDDILQRQRNIFRIIRTCLGLSQSEMAYKVGISKVYLAELEQGRRSNPSVKVLDGYSYVSGLKRETIEYLSRQSDINYSKLFMQSLEDYLYQIRRYRPYVLERRY